jgi:hypothetical protein
MAVGGPGKRPQDAILKRSVIVTLTGGIAGLLLGHGASFAVGPDFEMAQHR